MRRMVIGLIVVGVVAALMLVVVAVYSWRAESSLAKMKVETTAPPPANAVKPSAEWLRSWDLHQQRLGEIREKEEKEGLQRLRDEANGIAARLLQSMREQAGPNFYYDEASRTFVPRAGALPPAGAPPAAGKK